MGFWKTFKQGAGITAGMMAGTIIGSVLWAAALATTELWKEKLGINDKSSDKEDDGSSTEEEES